MNGENPTKTVTYPWKEVKNKFIYDLIKDIL
jgi:hypothetical protein